MHDAVMYLKPYNTIIPSEKTFFWEQTARGINQIERSQGQRAITTQAYAFSHNILPQER
jgi:hypothetical protein